MVWHEIRWAAVKQPVSIENTGVNDQFVKPVYKRLYIPFAYMLSSYSTAYWYVLLFQLYPSGVSGYGSPSLYRRAATSMEQGAGRAGGESPDDLLRHNRNQKKKKRDVESKKKHEWNCARKKVVGESHIDVARVEVLLCNYVSI